MPRGVIFAATAFVVVVGLFLLWPRTTAPVPDDTVQPVAQTETPPAPAPAREAPTLDVSTPTKLFTEREFVVVRGRVNAGAGVWVDGLRANLRDGVFEERVAVPAFGAQQVHVVARNPSGPPREVVIDVERVRDLRVVLRRVKYDRKLSYPKLMADLEARRGARVSYVGRVYSASVGGGAAVLQVFVDRCTLPSRCPLWVTHGAPTSLAEGRRVRIVGEVQGTERLSVRGDVMDVPHISAELVLPLGK
ncbi:MAG: hypothetical protein KC417_10575 [Myxococcales bacterium]|nr:hypothetical protein [Myxococcales bacterium]